MTKKKGPYAHYQLGQSLVLLILIFAFSGCKSENDKKPEKKEYKCINSDHPGYTKIEQDSAVREYILHVPSSYERKTPCPLIINFHGYGGCASNFAKNVSCRVTQFLGMS